jgi:hypothetical protein
VYSGGEQGNTALFSMPPSIHHAAFVCTFRQQFTCDNLLRFHSDLSYSVLRLTSVRSDGADGEGGFTSIVQRGNFNVQ